MKISQKKIAAEILKCGVNRVKIENTKEVKEALTRNDIRNLIRKGLIKKTLKKSISKVRARKIREQKKKGRRKGIGSRKGTKKTKNPKKKNWINKIRPLRKMLCELRDKEKIERKTYRKLFLMCKGGMFRNKKHLMFYIKEHELFREKHG